MPYNAQTMISPKRTIGDNTTWWFMALWLLPLLVFAAVMLVASTFQIFEGVPLVGQTLTPVQAAVLLGAMFFPVEAAYFAHMQWNRARARLSRTWPTAMGRVEKSAVKEYQDFFAPWNTIYRLAITYRYEVNGQAFVGHRVQFGFQLVPPELIDGFATRFATGAQVPIHHDPNSPQIAVLDTSDRMAVFQSKRILKYLIAMYFLIIAATTTANTLGYG